MDEGFRKLYEGIGWGKLRQEARRWNFDPTILECCIHAYGGRRYLVQSQMALDVGFASRTVVAGCSKATGLVKLFYKFDIGAFVTSHPELPLHLYVDDSQLEGIGEGDVFIDNFTRAVNTLKAVCTGPWKPRWRKTKSTCGPRPPPWPAGSRKGLALRRLPW